MVLQALTEGAAIAQTAQQIFNEVNTFLSKGVVVQIENRTSISLTLSGQGQHDSGGFNNPPDPTIPPSHVSTFGSKGSLGLGDYLANGVSGGFH